MGLLDRLYAETKKEEPIKTIEKKPEPVAEKKPESVVTPAPEPVKPIGGGLLSKLSDTSLEPGSGLKTRIAPKIDNKDKGDPYESLRDDILDRIISEIDPDMLKMDDMEKKEGLLKRELEEMVVNMASERGIAYSATSHKKLIREVLDDILGLGPIEEFLRREEVSEIMVNGPKQIYVEEDGKLVLTEKKFRDNDHALHVLEKIVAPLGRRCDESVPMVDARLKDGSRVNAIIPPLALNGPTITIRKFKKDKLQISDLVRFGSLTQKMADFIEACVKVRLNIVVSGGTGSGKTTTLNILSCFIPSDERIITCEDAAEIQLRQDHVVSLESRPPNIEGKGAVSIRDLIKNTLRMRPERVIVGECRSGEALDMLQAMNTGHDGSLTTGHANTPRDMISRLETMCLMAGMDLPLKAIREQIASAVDLIVQQSRLKDGSRKITHITEVQGMEGEIVTLSDIFIFKQKGKDPNTGKIIGSLEPTGIRPKFIDKFEQYGIHLPADIFLSSDRGW